MTQVTRRFQSTGKSVQAATETIREARDMARTDTVQAILDPAVETTDEVDAEQGTEPAK